MFWWQIWLSEACWPSAESVNVALGVTATALEGSVLVSMTDQRRIFLLWYFYPSGKEAPAGIYFRKDRYIVVGDIERSKLKASAKMKKGKEICLRRKVQDDSIAPINWVASWTWIKIKPRCLYTFPKKY